MSRRPPKGRTLSTAAISTLTRLLAEKGLSARQIDRSLDYVVAQRASTMREGFVLAMSRTIFDDAQLAAGQRYAFEDLTPEEA